jgi:DNA-directed RNA polymerase specialized sigma24 family protein
MNTKPPNQPPPNLKQTYLSKFFKPVFYRTGFFVSLGMLTELATEHYLQICRAITNDSDLSHDLWIETILTVDRLQPPTPQDADKLFKYIAKKQWNEPGRFMRMYRHRDHYEDVTDIAEDSPAEFGVCEEFILFLLKKSLTDEELVTLVIVKLRIQGMTLRDIAEETGLILGTIQNILKQFEHDINSGIYSDRVSDFLALRNSCVD